MKGVTYLTQSLPNATGVLLQLAGVREGHIWWEQTLGKRTSWKIFIPRVGEERGA